MHAICVFALPDKYIAYKSILPIKIYCATTYMVSGWKCVSAILNLLKGVKAKGPLHLSQKIVSPVKYTSN